MPAGRPPNITAKKAGIITAGLNCPTPHGEGIYAVKYDPTAYNAAHIAIEMTNSDVRLRFVVSFALAKFESSLLRRKLVNMDDLDKNFVWIV